MSDSKVSTIRLLLCLILYCSGIVTATVTESKDEFGRPIYHLSNGDRIVDYIRKCYLDVKGDPRSEGYELYHIMIEPVSMSGNDPAPPFDLGRRMPGLKIVMQFLQKEHARAQKTSRTLLYDVFWPPGIKDQAGPTISFGLESHYHPITDDEYIDIEHDLQLDIPDAIASILANFSRRLPPISREDLHQVISWSLLLIQRAHLSGFIIPAAPELKTIYQFNRDLFGDLGIEPSSESWTNPPIIDGPVIIAADFHEQNSPDILWTKGHAVDRRPNWFKRKIRKIS